VVFLTAGFIYATAEKRLDVKSLKGQTKAKELWYWAPELVRLQLALTTL
jgi:hypothetical protein